MFNANEVGRGAVPELNGLGGRLRILLLVLVMVTIFVGFIWPVIGIQLRLSRNGAIANQLVDSLRTQLPGVEIRGGPSYESEVIYIGVYTHVEEARRSEIEKWLRHEKAKQKIKPKIKLQVWDNDLKDIEF